MSSLLMIFNQNALREFRFSIRFIYYLTFALNLKYKNKGTVIRRESVPRETVLAIYLTSIKIRSLNISLPLIFAPL